MEGSSSNMVSDTAPAHSRASRDPAVVTPGAADRSKTVVQKLSGFPNKIRIDRAVLSHCNRVTLASPMLFSKVKYLLR